MTIYFLKDLMAGRKKRVKGKDVKWIAIPQYKALTIDKIAAYVAPHGVVGDHLPIDKAFQYPQEVGWMNTIHG